MCSSQESHRITVRGSPIRTSTDHGMCAPPRRLSQLTTSFLASARLGIHRVPLVACQPFGPSANFPKNSSHRLATTTRNSPSLGILPIRLSKTLVAVKAKSKHRSREIPGGGKTLTFGSGRHIGSAVWANPNGRNPAGSMFQN